MKAKAEATSATPLSQCGVAHGLRSAAWLEERSELLQRSRVRLKFVEGCSDPLVLSGVLPGACACIQQ